MRSLVAEGLLLGAAGVCLLLAVVLDDVTLVVGGMGLTLAAAVVSFRRARRG